MPEHDDADLRAAILRAANHRFEAPSPSVVAARASGVDRRRRRLGVAVGTVASVGVLAALVVAASPTTEELGTSGAPTTAVASSQTVDASTSSTSSTIVVTSTTGPASPPPTEALFEPGLPCPGGYITTSDGCAPDPAAPPGTGEIAGSPGGAFQRGPLIDNITPDVGPAAGGTRVVIAGRGLANATGAYFDGQPGADLVYDAQTDTLTVTSPPHAPGPAAVTVTVLSDDGTEATSSAATFTYQ